jgi:hypothetical protein
MAPPELDGSTVASTKWEREQRAFWELRPSLLQTHAEKFVAIHEGKVVDSDDDRIPLALRVYARFGYVPIYVAHVSQPVRSNARVPSPRKLNAR